MSAFVSAMQSTPSSEVVLTLTANGAPSYGASGEALVDLFFKSVRGLSQEELLSKLKSAWTVSPLLTLKLIAYIRNIRGGKGERDLGRWSLGWLAVNHPNELLVNLEAYLGTYGRWDDGVHLVASGTPGLSEGVYRVYREQLEKDYLSLTTKVDDKEAGSGSVSLCAKWTPSEGKAEDRVFHFNKGLAASWGLTHKQLRERLTLLRKKIDLLETHLCDGTLSQVDYSKVPSVAMNRHGKPEKAFSRKDGERFAEYKSKLVKGDPTVKVNVGAVYPHEIVGKYLQGYDPSTSLPYVDDLTEGQWRAICEKLTAEERSYLSGLVTMVDVSGSMYDAYAGGSARPIDVAVSLGLLVAEMNPCPHFHNTIMTFSSDPQFYRVEGDTLWDKVTNLSKASWGMSTDLAKAFRMILNRGKEFKLTQEEMPKTLMIISDMQFNSASVGRFETNYQALDREFRAAGYLPPKVIFWNVNGSIKDFPVVATQCNTALISGFSIEILKDVLKGEEITPFKVMLRILEGPDYDLIRLPSSQPLNACVP